MMTTIVILQPMLFPWQGVLEQIKLADIFVHYDDVAFSRGSFVNRVQVKCPHKGNTWWMTIPLAHKPFGTPIMALEEPSNHRCWRARHLAMLERVLDKDALGYAEALAIAKTAHAHTRLVDVLIDGIEQIATYFDIQPQGGFMRSSTLGIRGTSWQRILAITQALGGKRYVSGLGGARYTDHEAFERAGIPINYMDYAMRPYPQGHGSFTPFVTSLHLIASMGRAGRSILEPRTVPWRDLLKDRR